MLGLMLPAEIVLDILAVTPDIRDVLAYAATCTYFKLLVEGSIAIEYRIALAKAGYQDGPTTPDSSLTQRLELLRKHERAWNTFDWIESRILDVPRTFLDQIARGIYTTVQSQSRVVNCIRAPSILCGTDLSMWTHDIGFTCFEFATDPERDLLLMLECPPDWVVTPAVPRVHVRTLSTNAPSPLANEELLQLSEERYLCYDATMHIMGSKIGVLFPRSSRLVIWHIFTGNIHVSLQWQDCFDSAFDFLTNTSILRLCIKEPDFQPYIDVITFSSEGSHLVASFQLPRIITERPRYSGHFFDHSRICSLASSICQDPPGLGTYPSQQRPFYPDANHHIISFRWRMTAAEPRESPTYHLFVPIHVFLNPTHFLLNDCSDGSTGPVNIEWPAWGPQFSRLLRDDSCRIARVGHSAMFGNRFVAFLQAGTQSTGWPAHESRNLLALYDFNRARIYNDEKAASLPNRKRVVTIHDVPETLEDPFFVEGSVTTSLPFRLSLLGHKDFEGDDVLAYDDTRMWFDEEHIVFLKFYKQRMSTELVIFTM